MTRPDAAGPGKAMLIAATGDTPEDYRELLRNRFPELPVFIVGEPYDPAAIAWVICWRPPVGLIASLPNLEVIFSMAAGVDHILVDPTLPQEIPIVRLVHERIGEQIRDYAIHAVLYYYRQMDLLSRHQAERHWEFIRLRPKSRFRIGVLGLGNMGRAVGRGLADLGFPVLGWSRSPKELPGLTCYSGRQGLMEMLPQISVLVSILPSTEETVGLLDAEVFGRMPKGAVLVNLGRGNHLVEADLLAALESGHLRGAMLDVFRQEPLPTESTLWHHPLLRLTPHIGSDNDADIVVAAVADNLERIARGLPPEPIFDRARGY